MKKGGQSTVQATDISPVHLIWDLESLHLILLLQNKITSGGLLLFKTYPGYQILA